MPMYNYVVRRVGFTTVMLLFVTLIVFIVTNTLPGNVALLILGPNTTEQSSEALRTQLGLNRPLYVQYIDWVVGLPRGNMGESLRFGEPVVQLIAERLPRSTMFMIIATLVAVVLSVPLGVYAAVSQDEAPDVSASVSTSIGVSMPIFLWGLVFILMFAVQLSLSPTGGYVSPGDNPVRSLMRLVPPAGAAGSVLTTYIIRMIRSLILEVLNEEHINLVRTKGMSQWAIVLRHALENAIIPVVTVIASQFDYVFDGVAALEEVFFWLGISRLTLTAIQSRDIPLIQGCILMVALIYMFSNFAADLLYAYFDPRTRYGGDD